MSQRLAECCCVAQTGDDGGCDVCPKWPSSFSCQIQVSGNFYPGLTGRIPFSMSESMVLEVERCIDGTGGRCSFANRVTLNHPLYEAIANSSRCTQMPFNGTIATIRADSGYWEEFGYKYRVAVGVLGCSMSYELTPTQSQYELVIAFGTEIETISPYFGVDISRPVRLTANPSDNNSSIPWTCCPFDLRENFQPRTRSCWTLGSVTGPEFALLQSVALKNPCDLPTGAYSGVSVQGWNVTATIS